MKQFDLSTLNLPSGTSYPITVVAKYYSEASSLDSEPADPVYYYPTGSVVDIKVECSIDFDDEWTQEDCHWNYRRYFDLTWKIWSEYVTNTSTGELVDGTDYSEKALYYSLSGDTDTQVLPGTYSSTVINDAPWTEGYTRKLEIFKYRLYISSISIERLVAAAEKGFYITAKANVKSYSNKTISNSYTYNLDLELPPKLLDGINLNRESSDHIICAWSKAEPNINTESGASVAGYAIELFGKKKGTNTFKQISDLSISKEADGKYKLVRATGELPEEYTFADASTIKEEDDLTFIGCGDKLEAFIDDPNVTEFYFNPSDFEVAPGNPLGKDDDFQIVVYPYVVYGSYIDGQAVKQGTLLTNSGTSSEEMKFKLGVVRVKTEGGWVEGQVWVMTDKGWKEADSVYAMVDDGTGKGVWKEAM